MIIATVAWLTRLMYIVLFMLEIDVIDFTKAWLCRAGAVSHTPARSVREEAQ